MTTKTDPKATSKRDYTARTAFAIQNGNGARFTPLSFERCTEIAREAVANTSGTLKEINAYLRTNRRALGL